MKTRSLFSYGLIFSAMLMIFAVTQAMPTPDNPGYSFSVNSPSPQGSKIEGKVIAKVAYTVDHQEQLVLRIQDAKLGVVNVQVTEPQVYTLAKVKDYLVLDGCKRLAKERTYGNYSSGQNKLSQIATVYRKTELRI